MAVTGFTSSGTDFNSIFLARSTTILPVPYNEANGKAWFWGTNSFGIFGDSTFNTSTTSGVSSPVQISSTNTWRSVTVGAEQAGGIRTDGTLWTWGNNTNGTLGTGDTNHRSSPTQIGTKQNWSYIMFPLDFALALETDGSVWSWGSNTYGQLGNNNSGTNVLSPVQIGGIGYALSPLKVVAAGGYSCFGLGYDSTLWVWGYNGSAQLGTGDTLPKSLPTALSGAPRLSSVYNSGGATVAIGAPGQNVLWGWGAGSTGQLGLNSTGTYTIPTILSNSLWNFASSDANISTAIRADNSLWVAGSGLFGENGQGVAKPLSSSFTQIGGLTNWKQINAIGYASISIKIDGTMWAWGRNDYGQLGLNDTVHRSSPVQIGTATVWKTFAQGSALNAIYPTMTVGAIRE